MNKTAIILLCGALLTSLIAYWPASAMQDQSIENKRLVQSDIEAAAIGRIRICAWDARALSSQSIDIERNGEKWVLPAHYRYPANAGARVGELAGTLMQVELGRILAEDMQAWNDFGLYDPMKDEYSEGRKFGRRVTVWDDKGAEFLDIIIGELLPGSTSRRYMRFVNDHKSYAINFDQDLPVQFKDWVDTALLPVKQADVRELKIRQYSFNEQMRRPQFGLSLSFKRNNVDKLWTSVNTNTGDMVDDTAVERVIRGAIEARLHEVRPFEKHINKMARYGFFPNQNFSHIVGNTQIFGNEGLVTVTCNNGIEYFIFLGEVAEPEHQNLMSSGLQYRYAAVLCRYNAPQDESINRDNLKERMQAGERLALELNHQFMNFIYMISEDSFQRMHPNPKKLYKKAETKE